MRESTSGSTPMRSIKNSNDGEGFDPDEDSTDEAKKSPQGYDQDEDSLDAIKKNAMPKLKGKTGKATEKPKLPKAPKAVKPKDPKEDQVGRIKSVSVVEPEMPEFDTLSTSKLQALEEIDPQKISRAASSYGGARGSPGGSAADQRDAAVVPHGQHQPAFRPPSAGGGGVLGPGNWWPPSSLYHCSSRDGECG